MNMNMNMNEEYPHDVSFYLWLCGRRIRVYSLFPIVSGDFRFPPQMLAQSLQYYDPLPYPYTWYVFAHQAAIVNINDLQHSPPSSSSSSSTQPLEYENHYYSQTIDEVVVLQEGLNINQSFEQPSTSGLTNKLISKNLRVTKYCAQEEEEEEDETEICVVCQVEFQNNERVAVLQCKHHFHSKCIKEWLLRKNICPLCNTQALMV